MARVDDDRVGFVSRVRCDPDPPLQSCCPCESVGTQIEHAQAATARRSLDRGRQDMSDVDPTAHADEAPTATIEERASNGHGNGNGEVDLVTAPKEAPSPYDGAEEAAAIAPELADEPTTAGALDELSPDVGAGPATLAAKRRVRGRYRSTGTGFQVELRVDVDGPRPMKRVSA